VLKLSPVSAGGPGTTGPQTRIGPESRVMPLLTIVIPAFNIELFIGAAVASALNQRGVNLEVIVVDDGSTDATRTRVEAISDPRLRLIAQSNRGLSGARNTGIRNAFGKYIGFLDGDDVWLPDFAARLIAEMQADATVGAIYSAYRYIDEHGRPAGQPLLAGPREPSLRRMLHRNYGNSHMIVRKECVEQVGLFDESLRSCEDYEFLVRILAKSRYVVRSVPDRLALYRVRSGSLTGNFEQFLQNAERAINLIRTHCPGASARTVRRSRAECYPIASRKALAAGQLRSAQRHLAQALALAPLLLVTDLRAAATAFLTVASSCAPSALKHVPYELARKLVGLLQALISKP
jgi:GT2 family glycosyltransferase